MPASTNTIGYGTRMRFANQPAAIAHIITRIRGAMNCLIYRNRLGDVRAARATACVSESDVHPGAAAACPLPPKPRTFGLVPGTTFPRPHRVHLMFVRNQWYVASWDHEIDRAPHARTICGEPIVLYRKFDRTVVALQDACPHRLLPLSMGIKEGDNIR